MSEEVGLKPIFRETLDTCGTVGQSSEAGVRRQLHSRAALLEKRLMEAARMEVCCSRSVQTLELPESWIEKRDYDFLKTALAS